MKEKKILDIYNCCIIQGEGELYPLQKWHNQIINKCVSEINVDDVIRMIRQHVFIEIAISKAISFLKTNPFAGEQYEGELLEIVSTIDIYLVEMYIDDLRYILVLAHELNQTYDWLIEKEREDFEELIIRFSRKLENLQDSR